MAFPPGFKPEDRIGFSTFHQCFLQKLFQKVFQKQMGLGARSIYCDGKNKKPQYVAVYVAFVKGFEPPTCRLGAIVNPQNIVFSVQFRAKSAFFALFYSHFRHF